MKRAHSEETSDSEREEKRSWLGGTRERKKDQRVIVSAGISMFELPSEDEDVPTKEKPLCPVTGCTVRTRKVKNHVNRLHLPKLMWDNHYPPVKEEKIDEFNSIRYQVLQFFARKLLGTESLPTLLQWCARTNLIPKRSPVTARQIEQMRSLTATMGWSRPSYNRYSLYPPNHISVLIHWRYLVGMLQRLAVQDVTEFMDFGIQFMNDQNNLETAKGQKQTGETIISRALQDATLEKETQPDWDQSEDVHRKVELQKDSKIVVTVDVCGEPDDVDSDPSPKDEDIEESRVVTIGPANYTLVLRGLSLDISGDHRRPASLLEQSLQVEPTTERWEAYDVFDSHFHLDRSSMRLLGNHSLTMDDWLQEPMERPPRIPVNVVGGTLIFCDPESFPSSIPIQEKWRIAVGIHPKKVQTLTGTQLNTFWDLVRSERVAAVGEIGIDRTVSEKYWEDQLTFLKQIAPELKLLNKPIIFHIRSNQFDFYSQLTYLVILKFCTEYLSASQKFILHCFTGTKEIVDAWLTHFPNTYFGVTYLVASFDEKQKAALRSIPSNRLLVETDSPYITPRGISSNSPIYLGEVIVECAKVRGQTLEQICRWTTINAGIFGLK